jgi:phosphomannomutase
VLQALPSSFSTPELHVPCEQAHAVVVQLIGQAQFPAPAVMNVVDGLRVDWPDGFGLVRASNTNPVLVLRFEGQTEAALHRIDADMRRLLHSVQPDTQLEEAAL